MMLVLYVFSVLTVHSEYHTANRCVCTLQFDNIFLDDL